ncbi:excalibur calcium-binding domain-containing protein [Bacillus cereus]|uniref:Calcium-binding protein n=1 Tax=Bacillus thuringiensis serovar yosoo TaxID=180848 RepID=A0A9X6IC51_BACTU|nr:MULTISPECIES: excalibur calcium-binding domain-containing protein [Bacillus cereus group]MRB78262.1 calcium-binding protein [Bacillus thuringiensis]MCE9754103.1 excalibur calcium-binding domain-containing protein [Bacillus cereus]MDA2182989.1 excalibur calcium-binding domain-containing protein [Bacillus cereus]MDA2233301.1 excalibur calcium-binding domain-containing protein [Bacillus cereus]MDF9492574.1 excalibur calcium-binding domain-containing protein [Bacillus cereus]
MSILSNIGAALFFIAFILLILCIISFFKKNGKAKQYGRPTVILFMISIILITAGTTKSEHPVVEFFSTLSFILFIFFLVLAILSVIKKTGVAKKQFIITAVLFVIFVALLGISAPSSEKTTATSTKVASNNEEPKDSEQKKELEKKEADEKTQKQEDEKRLAEEQARKQEDEKRQADEQARKQEDEKRQADEQARKQQEEQKRQADEQARKQQEEQKRQADEQARKQQEEQKRQADEQARKQQEEQKAQQAQTQPANGNTDSAYYKNCAAVRAAGKAPLHKGQPGYSSHLDRDGDGIACEK